MADIERLKRFLKPRHIAILGGKWSDEVVRQCRAFGFDGPIWPIHPKRDELAGEPCFRTLEDLPEAPDAVFIGVNRHVTIETVGLLNAMGAGGAVCFASGFAEVGEEGAALQAELVAAAGDMPIAGPNCYGILNYLDGLLQDKRLAEEVLQDVMFAVWEKASNFRGESKVRTWLFSIARNRAINALRGHQLKIVPFNPELANSSSDNLAQFELSEALEQAFEGLPSRQREVLEMKFYHGLKMAEIAVIVRVLVRKEVNLV